MFFKFLFVFHSFVILYLINVTESRENVSGQHLTTKSSALILVRVKRTFSDKFWELKMHEFDALLSLKIWKLKMIWWYIVWVKRIWLRILSQLLKHVGIELTEEDIRGPFPPYEQSFTNEFMQSNSNNNINNNVNMLTRGKRSDDLLVQSTVQRFWKRVKESRHHRLQQLKGQRLPRTQAHPVFKILKYALKNGLASQLIKTKALSFSEYTVKLLNYMENTGKASCEYEEICEMSSFITSTTPQSMKKFISSEMDLIELVDNLDFENKYIEAITVGVMNMNCHNYYKDIC